MLAIDKDTTRIDFEKFGDGVMVMIWNGRWNEGSAPCRYDYQTAASIDRLLMQCEDAGFTCEMAKMDGSLGRALRGEITRIDIMELVPGKWKGQQIPARMDRKTRAIEQAEKSDEQAKAAIAWCKENGWQVREFPGGARAWKYEVMPVRDSSTIQRMRRQVDQHFNRGEMDSRRQYDLAFDC